MSRTFDAMATVACSTKRKPTISGGKAGAPATSISSMSCWPLQPLSDQDQLSQTFQLETLVNMLETYVQGTLDILTGDILVIGSTEYPIRIIQSWPFDGSIRYRLVVEDLKRNA